MPTDFVTLGYLGTYGGAVAATYLIVSLLKGMVKAVLPDYFVRILALVVALLILGTVLISTGGKLDPGTILITVINAFLVVLGAMGFHQAASDPSASKILPVPHTFSLGAPTGWSPPATPATTGSSVGDTMSSGGTPGGFVPKA